MAEKLTMLIVYKNENPTITSISEKASRAGVKARNPKSDM